MLLVHVSDMLPKRAHGPLQETAYPMPSLEEAHWLELGVCTMRAGLSGQRWNCYMTLSPPSAPAPASPA